LSISTPDSRRERLAVLTIVWILALACVVFTRFRGEWPSYKSLHTWLDAQGVPGWVRNLDSFLLFMLIAALGAVSVHLWLRRASVQAGGAARSIAADSPASLLGLRRGRAGWLPVCLLPLAPMVIGGAVLGIIGGNLPAPASTVVPAVWSGVIRAAVQEELFFRGLLVGVVASAAIGWSGRAFWINATFAAALFGAMHIKWTLDAAAAGWPNVLMTFAGGLWFTWLLARWRTLWVPMILHAGMNLGWMLAAAEGGAGGGGLVVNLLRVATIAIATWMTIRATRSAV
jgi:membrane protease YdiL (CAAX protease family)